MSAVRPVTESQVNNVRMVMNNRQTTTQIPAGIPTIILDLCDMAEAFRYQIPPDQFIIEVWRQEVGEVQRIFIYHTTVKTMPNNATSHATLATEELLDTFLAGMRIALSMMGYGVVLLSWDNPPQWQALCGRRWTIGRGAPCQAEYLKASGEVVNI